MQWTGGDFASLKGRTIRLKFELVGAKLYAFRGLKLATPKQSR
jgi:hypothetical protein